MISNRPRASRLSNFEISSAITPWIELHSVQLLLVINNDYECVRHRNFNTDTLNDFPSWHLNPSVAKINIFSYINNLGFTERYFSDKVHAILIEEVTVQTTLRDGASSVDSQVYYKD